MARQPPNTLRVPGSAMAAPTATHGSQTILQTESSPSEPPNTLRLRAERSESRHIQWAEDVIDNEGMGKKSSKVCCIYHKPREAGDSESESSSDSSDSDSDSEPDLSRAQKSGSSRGRHDRKTRQGNGKGKEPDRKPSPNAYERQPKNRDK